tara:strand:+ start:7196 stop:7564 length:369 start_codon:yes stop_codon:yes gene_type:complete
MKITKRKRLFKVGVDKKISLKDVGSIKLNNDENITFVDKNSKEYDVCKKNWGYYATPTINKRLKNFGYLTGLVHNKELNTFVINIVDIKKKKIFFKYLKKENMKLICWLTNKNLKKIKEKFK